MIKSSKAILSTLGLLASVGAGQIASANDGGTPYIKVNQVEANVHFGDTMTVRGGDAYKLYSILPRDFVYDVTRSLTITSKKASVAIRCKQNPVDVNAEPEVGNPATTECSISFNKAYDPSKGEGDSFEWAPLCKEE